MRQNGKRLGSDLKYRPCKYKECYPLNSDTGNSCLSNCMGSPPREANSHSAGQQISPLFGDLKG